MTTKSNVQPADREAIDRMAKAMNGSDSHPVSYDIVGRRQHRGSINLLIDLTDGGDRKELFVKRLRSHAVARFEQSRQGHDRPRLKCIPDPATRLADEAVALESIERMVEDSGRDDWFSVGVVPVSDCPDVLVLERIDAPTMAQRIEAAGASPGVEKGVRSLGEWLHTLHHHLPPVAHARPHLTESTDVVRIITDMVDHIGDRRLTRRRAEIVAALAVLPPGFDVVPSHGDLAPQNVFLTHDNSIGVFDTSVELLMPPHFDLAYFAVMLEFAGFKTPLARTLARSQQLAEQLRVGYGADLPPRSELLAFELALLLDRWCSLAERRGPSSPIPTMARWARRQLLAARLHGGINRRLDELGAV